MDVLTDVARFAAETPSVDVPDEVIAKTALILADTVGAIVGGAAEPDVSALATSLAAGNPGPALVLGGSLKAARGTAALLNGTAGTTLEMDEGNQFARGHPGIHVIPAILAWAEGREITGRDLLAAIAVGYDVAARVGIASALRPSMHPHGTWGAVGATAAVQRLAGADAATLRDAMSMAASLGLTTSRRTMLEGGTIRNLFAGVSNQMGLLTADLTSAGITGDLDGVSHVFGHVAADRFDPEAFVDGLGSRWEVSRNYFKMHSCCRYNHAALDVLDQLLARDPRLAADDIARIDVATYALAVELDDPEPRNVLAGKFSVPFALATVIANRSSQVGSFTIENVRNPAIRALAARVTVTEDPAMTAALPDRRPAKVDIHLKDGRTLSGATETNRGDWTDPYPRDEIHEKYLSLTTRLWSLADAQGIWDTIARLDEAGDAAMLLAVMVRAGAD